MAFVRTLLAVSLGAFFSLGVSGESLDNKKDKPLFIGVKKSDHEFHLAINQAQRTLPIFRTLISTKDLSKDSAPLIKKYFNDGDGDGDGVWLWLIVIGEETDGFYAETFEAPPELQSLKVGTRFFIPNGEIADWMLNNNGELHGGYTLRLQRSRLAASKRQSFDKHVGVKRYLPLPP